MTLLNLVDEVNGMTNRASSVLTMLEDEFIGENDCRLNDEIIYHVIESAIKELADIKRLVNAFHNEARNKLTNNEEIKAGA